MAVRRYGSIFIWPEPKIKQKGCLKHHPNQQLHNTVQITSGSIKSKQSIKNSEIKRKGKTTVAAKFKLLPSEKAIICYKCLI